MSLIGIIVISIALGMGLGYDLTTFIDTTSLIITLGGAISLLLFSGINVKAMFKGVFAKNMTADELRAGARGWEFFGIYTLVVGALGTLIGLVLMLQHIDDPTSLLPATAVCLLTHVYGFGLASFISMPLRKKLETAASVV